jgi:acetolactate synthase I/II/III large subunit
MQRQDASVVERLARMLVDEGTEIVFGVTGDGNLELLTELTAKYGVPFVHARHEQGAVAMAEGYARFSGRIGVCTVTQGPGLTNTATSLATAAAACAPVLLIAADVAASDVHHVQRFDQAAFVRSTGCAFKPVFAGSAEADLAAAFRHLRGGRGPVVLDVPLDVQQVRSLPTPSATPAAVPVPPSQPADEAVDAAAELLAQARRPVMLIGRGVLASAGGEAAVRELAETLACPVATTFMAHGALHGYERSLGLAGGLSAPATVDALEGADCIMAIGASLNAWTTAAGTLVSNATLLQIDADPAAIGRITPVHAGLAGDAALTCRALAARLTPRGDKARPHDAPWAPTDYQDLPDAVDPRRALDALDAALDDRRLVVLDTGHFTILALQHLTVSDPRRFALTLSFAAIGQGLPTAIGAAFAHPGERVTLVAGDGGLLMSLYELETAIRSRLPLTVFVVNDAGYGQERHSLAAKGLARSLADHGTPDLAAVARAMGGSGLRIDSPAGLEQLPAALAEADGTLLVDVRVNPTFVSPASAEIARRMRGAH